MNDEQTTALLGLLTEIRDELRLVRSVVLSDNDDPSDLSYRLQRATTTFERSQWYKTLFGLSKEELLAALQAENQRSQPINAVASQRVLVPETT